ncbi:MAG: phosphotransferase, partial [Planctomycetota bacterium]
FGLDGTTVRIDLEHEGNGPRQIVAKLCGAARGEKETRFYRDLGPGFPATVPAFHGGRWDDEAAVLLVESIEVELQGDILRGAPDDALLRIAAAEATFHARYWDERGLEDLDWLPELKDPPERLREMYAEAEPAFLERWGTSVPDAARREFAALAYEASTVENRIPGPRTLVHTDLHLDNVVFRHGGEPVFLDWPDVRRGPCALDVARLLAEVATREQRPRLQDAILETHARGLADGGVGDYSEGDLRRDVIEASRHVLGWVVLWSLRDEERDRHPRVRALNENGVLAAAESLAGLLASGA